MSSQAIRFGVITRVPTSGDGNQFALPAKLYPGLYQPSRDVIVSANTFELGEILILDADGRELSGRGRKPSKWDVTCEMFDEIGPAVMRAISASASEPEAKPTPSPNEPRGGAPRDGGGTA